MSAATGNRPRSRQVVWAAALLAAALCALAAGFIGFEARSIRMSELGRLELFARTLENQTSATLGGTDSLLRALLPAVEQAAASSDAGRLSALLSDSLRGRPFIRAIALADSEGQVLASSNFSDIGAVLPASMLRPIGPTAGNASLFAVVSGRDFTDLGRDPLRQARAVALPMSLPVHIDASTLQLVALVNPDYLATQFERTLGARTLRATLIGMDTFTVTATSNASTHPGSSVPAIAAFAKYLPAIEAASEMGLGVDGEITLGAFRATRQWPVIVQVEQPCEVYFAMLYDVMKWVIGALAVGLALLAWGATVVRRSLLRDEQLTSDLVAAHTATRASESRKLAVLQSSLDAIVSIDANGDITDFNPAAERMFGITAAQAFGRPMHEIMVPPELREAHSAGMRRYLAGGGARILNRRIEVEAARADGTRFPVELTVVPVNLGSGEVFTATLRDITERQRVERALRDSEARATAAFEQAAVGVLQQAVDRRFVRVNQTLCRMLGYTAEEFLALQADFLIHPEDIAPGLEGMQALFRGDLLTFAQDKRYRCKDGTWLWTRLTASILRDEAGQPVSLLGIVEDISARRRAEAAATDARVRELQIGARIQQSLLVTAPPQDLHGVHLSTYSQASQGIDGDFVEVVRIGPHCVDVIAGDVMGKGVAAALMGAATKLQFSRSIAELVVARGTDGEPPAPAAVVGAVHRAMTPALQTLDAFVTLCYVRIDTLRDTVTWVGCGHEEPLVVGPVGEPRVLANQHPPLGVLDDSDYVEQSCPLVAGETLFLYSDGLTDALRQDGERVGREILSETLTLHARHHHAPSAVLQSLRRDILSAGVQLQDDVTMVVVQRESVAMPLARVELPISLSALRQCREFVLDAMRATTLDESAAGLLEVACVEAFTNIARHARGLLEGAPIEITARHVDASLVFEFVYLGDAFQPPDELPETDLSAYPEGGFGLFIIRSACDKAEFLHVEGVNTVRMTKRIA